MKMSRKNLFLLPALIAGLVAMPAGRSSAQTFTTLHNFTVDSGDPDYTNSDGALPRAGLILSGNTLYGTACYGGDSGVGTVFAVNTDGTGFTNLHSLGSDGAYPNGLLLSGDTLYGTADYGGSWLDGTVFAGKTNGSGFTNLHSLTWSDGANPHAGLILSGTTLYGSSPGGGYESGALFKGSTDGTGFTNLHSFEGASDGAGPYGALILAGDTLYGTAVGGSTWGSGTVFALNTNGTRFTNLYNFSATSGSATYTNSDGARSYAGLILAGSTLYGAASAGGSSGNGTVFALHTDGSGFTTLRSFTAMGANALGVYTNSDGANPEAGLILSGDTLYGTASAGGSSGNGTVFAISTNGTGFATLHNFAPTRTNSFGAYTNSDGANPSAELILSGGTLYGTASSGGSSGNGTVFSLSLGSVSTPPLAIVRSGAYVILTWPSNATGFTLQCTTNLLSPTVWATVLLGPVVVNGQNIVTNLILGRRQFYRLSQ